MRGMSEPESVENGVACSNAKDYIIQSLIFCRECLTSVHLGFVLLSTCVNICTLDKNVPANVSLRSCEQRRYHELYIPWGRSSTCVVWNGLSKPLSAAETCGFHKMS